MKRSNVQSHAATYKNRKFGQEEEYQGLTEKTLDRGDYTVGWICVLPVELAAARVMRDEEHGQIDVAKGDTNSYVLGRIAAHGVVMACLPQGAVGTDSAATAATNVTRTFPKLRFILFVGVGAGSPDPDSPGDGTDIRLGDVVVSRPDDKSGGIIQYDFSNSLQSGVFDSGKSLNKPPRYPRVEKKFQYPGEAQDMLYQADYEHIMGETNCALCQSQYLVSRQHRDSSSPVVHYGLIASANQVIKDAPKRERIRKDIGVICFDMAAAGMMDDCPCLVVRGICDYADSHKNKQWQPYAALTAAAYAKELLQSMEASSIRNELVINSIDIFQDQLKVTQDQVEATRICRQRDYVRHQEDKHQACHRVFDTSEYEQLKNVIPDADEGACRWVLDHPRYSEWLTSTEDDLLWISADPGCGKSKLCKLLVDHWLQAKRPTILDAAGITTTGGARNVSTKSRTICYFFFRSYNEEQSSLATALCALLHQLFSQQPDMLRHALPAFRKNGGPSLRRNIDELWRILLAVTGDANVQPVTCVLDALDECRDNDQKLFINLLCDFYGRPSPSRLKWLVTGRPYYELQGYFSCLPRHTHSIQFRLEDELDLVLKARMEELCSRHNLSEAKAAEIYQLLRGIEDRTFLWLDLAIDDIEETLRAKSAMDEVELLSIPPTVAAAYEKILQRINNRPGGQYAKSILAIVAGASGPINLEEIALAFGEGFLSGIRGRTSDPRTDSIHLGDTVRQLCGSFVSIFNGQVQLRDDTARQFLVNSGYASNSDTPEALPPSF